LVVVRPDGHVAAVLTPDLEGVRELEGDSGRLWFLLSAAGGKAWLRKEFYGLDISYMEIVWGISSVIGTGMVFSCTDEDLNEGYTNSTL
jgi:hypothetical protein